MTMEARLSKPSSSDMIRSSGLMYDSAVRDKPVIVCHSESISLCCYGHWNGVGQSRVEATQAAIHLGSYQGMPTLQ